MKKIIIITIAIYSISIQIYKAQTPTWQWAKGFGEHGYEQTTGTVLDKNGNLYSLGWYTSSIIRFGSITLTNSGSSGGDVFLVKHNSKGDVLWGKNCIGLSGDIGSGISIDASGNVYITGWYASSSIIIGTYTLTNSAINSSDVFVAKIDPNGNTLWAKSFGGLLNDKGYSSTVDTEGNVYVTGSFNSATISFGTSILNNSGTNKEDIFLLKYNSSGEPLWAKRAGGAADDCGKSLALDNLNNIYLTGSFASTSIDFGNGSLSNSGVNTQDIFVAKYDADGNAKWSKKSGGSQDDFANSIAMQNENIFVTGGFNSTSIAFENKTLTNSSAGTSDVFLTQYDLSGKNNWAIKFGAEDSEVGNAIATDVNSNVYVGGYFASSQLAIGSNTLMNAGRSDLFVASFNLSGNFNWAETSKSGTDDEIVNSICVNALGTDICIGGMFNGYGVYFGESSINKGCGEDVFVAKLSRQLVGIEESKITDVLKLYPNPSTGKINLNASGQILFYNQLGDLIFTKKINGITPFDFSEIPKGIYLYKIINEEKGSYTGRFIIE